MSDITIIGAGLAGCEAAYQAARLGASVNLCEMKPLKYSPAHKSPNFCELVCSNSLRSDVPENAVGLLKEELRRLGSIVMKAADACRVPAGTALAVDREKFSSFVTGAIRTDPNITVTDGEITEIPEGNVIIATGPLTSDALAQSIIRLTGRDYLHFFDAAAPIVSGESIDKSKVFLASRYGKGEAAYINCPMNEEQYREFYTALTTATRAPLHEFEKDVNVFEGCMPVEIMASRGEDTLLFGPLKPVGLTDPKTGEEPFACVQLRAENVNGDMYNLVGFQTNLTFPEQKRVFGLIPGLENAEFLRYGVMHRNTYLNSPGMLNPTYETVFRPGLYFAGQMTGVEGYIESAASGFVAGMNAALGALGKEKFVFSKRSMIGAMADHIANAEVSGFQPMNANFGIIARLEEKVRGGKRGRTEYYARRSLTYIDGIKDNLFI